MRRSLKLAAALALCVVVAFASAAAPKPKTAFTTQIWSCPSSLDPQAVSMQDDVIIVNQIYDGLFQYVHEDMKQVKPCLAESYEVAKDYLSYTFHIRKGVTFHNGDELTAEDVAYTINRYIASPANSMYCGGLKGAEVLDKYTARLNLKYPVPHVEASWGYVTTGIVCKRAMEQFKGTDKSVVGTGAYKLKAWNPGESVELVANEQYFQGTPKIKTVTFRAIADPNAAQVAVENGEIDMNIYPSASGWVAAQQNPKNKLQMIAVRRNNSRILAFNTAYGPLKDIRVRQAINYAVDQSTINKMAHDGLHIPARQLTPPGCEGYIPDLKGYPRDIAKAKALLAEAGYTKDKPLTLTVSYNAEGASGKAVTAIQASLMEAGIQIKGNALEMQAWYEAMLSRKYEVGYFEMIMSPIMSALTYYVAFTSKGYYNVYNFADPEVDKWAGGAMFDLNDKTRIAALTAVNKRTIDQAIYLPLFFANQLIMANPKLKGLYFDNMYCLYKIYDMYWE